MNNPTLQAVIKIRTLTNLKEIQHSSDFPHDDHGKAFWNFKHQIIKVSGSPSLGSSIIAYSALEAQRQRLGQHTSEKMLSWTVMFLVPLPSLSWCNRVSAPSIPVGAFSRPFLSTDQSTVPGVGETGWRRLKPCDPLGEKAGALTWTTSKVGSIMRYTASASA